MSTITKEWLKHTIAEYEANRDELPFGLDTNSAIELQAFKLALASLEAEPVAYIIQDKADRKEGNRGQLSFKSVEQYHERDINEHELTATPLYTAPRAPTSVPDEIEPAVEAIKRVLPTSNPDEYAACIGADMWNACRAAMLHGADGNSPVITDGWVACSERLPPEGYEPDGGAVCYLVWHKNDVDCGPQYSISNVFFLRKHWEKNFTHWMPLPAAPQQEVKNG